MTTTINPTLVSLGLFWEIPLAALSFIFFKAMKLLIGLRYNFLLSKLNQQVLDWRPLCSEVLATPITLPFWMTFGPRLNTHAIIATVGPFTVKEFIDVHITAAQKSAKSWTIVVYSFPDYKTIFRIGSGNDELNQDWQTIKLTPGKYLLGLRYYNWPETVELPTIKVDGFDLIAAKIVSGDINDFYYQLRYRENFFYRCLHYYIFTLLRLRSWLPQSFVKREFLPVGDPSLTYFYGPVFQETSLKFDLNPRLLKNYDVYITIYDRSSFVVDFYQILEEHHTTALAETDGFYLVRVREKLDLQEKFVQGWLKIARSPAMNSYQTAV